MECKQNTIPQWDQGDIGIPTTWCVKITISEFASFLNFLYPRISRNQCVSVLQGDKNGYSKLMSLQFPISHQNRKIE